MYYLWQAQKKKRKENSKPCNCYISPQSRSKSCKIQQHSTPPSPQPDMGRGLGNSSRNWTEKAQPDI